MSDIYRHHNGYTVTRRDGDDTRIESNSGDYILLDKDEVKAMRDFFLSELGLWCDEETGALVMTGSWNGAAARVIFPDGDAEGYTAAEHPDRYDQVVIRWRATLAPPPRVPQPGEVWRVTLEDGSECNMLVGVIPTGAPIWRSKSGWAPIDTYPPAHRRILADANGTVVSDE